MSEISGTDLFGFFEERFGGGKGFTSEYIRYFEWSQNVKLRSAADWEALDATRRMWLDFALSTNRRGEALMDLLETRGPLRGRRYLDIGCGFGGCLVAAARRGAVCAGVESDPLRLEFARANTADWGVDALLVEGEPLAPGVAERLGRFDIVSISDGMERGGSPGALLTGVRRMVNRGGLVYAQFPNGGAIRAVESDGRFGLFGMTLLAGGDARRYHWEHFHWQYEGGDYYSFDECLRFFHDAGFRAELVNSVWHPASAMSEAPGMIAALDAARAKFHDPDPRLHEKICEAFAEYRQKLDADLARLPEEEFQKLYLRSFWTFSCKPV